MSAELGADVFLQIAYIDELLLYNDISTCVVDSTGKHCHNSAFQSWIYYNKMKNNVF